MDQELFFVWLFLSLGAGQLFHDLSTKQYSNCCFSVISPTKRKIEELILFGCSYYLNAEQLFHNLIGGAIFVWLFL
ncbi:hypothetical protein B1P92_01920 [Enterococcus faecium]|nr:hypothetical protein B1P92_01920 [Enterococcus faecium]